MIFSGLNSGSVKYEDVGSITASTTLKTLSCGGSNIKSSWVEILSSTSFEVQGFFLQLVSQTVQDVEGMLIDIGIGSSGSEFVLVPNIPYQTRANREQLLGSGCYFPLRIREGERISVRGQCNAGGAQNVGVQMMLLSNSIWPSPPLNRCVDIGANTATSLGVQIISSTNTKGSWYELTPTLDIDLKYLTIFWGTNGQQPDEGDILVDIGIGSSGSEEVIFSNLLTGSRNSDMDQLQPKFCGPLPCSIREGERIAVRKQNNVGLGNAFDAIILGIG